jgi:hypothetical protein
MQYGNTGVSGKLIGFSLSTLKQVGKNGQGCLLSAVTIVT